MADEPTSELEELPELSWYQQWRLGEGVPIHEDVVLADLRTIELSHWERVGVPGALITLAAQEQDDAELVEVPPGGQTAELRHVYEAMVFVVQGRGATTFWQPDGEKQTVEWGPGALFAPPLNSCYQHFNLDGEEPVRLFAVTSRPMVLNLFHNERFVFANDFVFDDRFDGDAGFFSGEGRKLARRVVKTNFVPDVRSFPLQEWQARGAGGKNIVFTLSSNTMASHVSEFPVGTYKKAHRHGAGAHVIIVSGSGYSLLWHEGDTEKRRIDWQDLAVLSPGDNEYHQHFNNGNEPARYLALRWNSPEFPPRGFNTGVFHEGPEQIQYEDQDADVHALFQADCRKAGIEVPDDPAQMGRG